MLVFIYELEIKALSPNDLPDFQQSSPNYTKNPISQQQKRISKKGERTFVPR
jgi:hypothetical protein